MFEAKDFIEPNGANVCKTYHEGKHICFMLKNGITVKVNPNKIPKKEGEKDAGHNG